MHVQPGQANLYPLKFADAVIKRSSDPATSAVSNRLRTPTGSVRRESISSLQKIKQILQNWICRVARVETGGGFISIADSLFGPQGNPGKGNGRRYPGTPRGVPQKWRNFSVPASPQFFANPRQDMYPRTQLFHVEQFRGFAAEHNGHAKHLPGRPVPIREPFS